MNSIHLLLSVLIITGTTFAKAPIREFSATITRGEKVTTFYSEQRKADLFLVLQSHGQSSERPITRQDLDFLLSSAKALPTSGGSCERSQVSVTALDSNGKAVAKTGCFLSENKESKAYSDLASLLAAMF